MSSQTNNLPVSVTGEANPTQDDVEQSTQDTSVRTPFYNIDTELTKLQTLDGTIVGEGQEASRHEGDQEDSSDDMDLEIFTIQFKNATLQDMQVPLYLFNLRCH